MTRRFGAFAIALTALACGSSEEAAPTVTDVAETADTAASDDIAAPPDPLAEAGFPLSVNAEAGTFTLGPLTGYAGGDGAYVSPIATRSATPVVGFEQGFYTFAEENPSAWAPQPVGLDAKGALIAGEATVTLEVVREGTVVLTVTAPEGHNRISLAFACPADERFFGFGGQSPRLEHRGERVPIWIQEQGLGKEPVLPEDQLSTFGRPYDAYYAVPFFLSPRGYGALVEETERTIFELCSHDQDAWRVEVWASELRLVLFAGDDPPAVLERATAHWGRPPAVPDWAFLPWIAAKGGTEHVRDQVTKLREAQVPASAIWSEDWLGESINPVTGFNIKYHWEWDPEHYPDLPAFIDELHAVDLKFMGYFNPFVTTEFSEWTEANEHGYLPLTPDGEVYQFDILTREGSVVDLTNPEARAWLLQHLQDARDLGIDGWMADYAEWLPFDARMHDGRTGAEASSDYPRLWQEVNRQACDPNDGCLFFVRSGFTGSNAIAPVAWGGDQNTDFGQPDGLPSAVRIGVGLGLTGVALYGSDIAGYTSAFNPPSTKELYFRWTQAGAFQPVMRTHEGNVGPENWQWDRDEETTAHFRRYARRHTRLLPLWKALMAEATATGLPIMRHPALHYPHTAAMQAVTDTYLLGDVLYVAPVVVQGASEREVALPPGRWVDWLTGASHAGDQTVTAPAPLTEIPVYAREGAIVPRLPADVDTVGAAQALMASHLELVVVPGADGAFTLADGTLVTMTSSVPAPALDLPACASDADRDCKVAGTSTLRLAGRSLSVSGLTIAIEGGPEARRYDVTVLHQP